MSEVVLLARNGDDVRLQALRKPLPVRVERRQRSAMTRAGRRGHEPDGVPGKNGERRDEDEGEDEHENTAAVRQLDPARRPYSGQFLM